MLVSRIELASRLVSLPRKYKRLIVLANDVFLLLFALWASFTLRTGVFFWPLGLDQWFLFLAAPAILLASLHFAGAYRRINRYVGRTGAKRTLTGLVLGILVWSLIAYLSGIDIIARNGIPRSIPFIYLALSFLFVWSNREFASWYLTGGQGDKESAFDKQDSRKILIWGYSEVALQFAHNLHLVEGYKAVGIIDADESLQFLKADDIKIFPPDYLDKLIAKEGISDIFIDKQIISKKQQLEIVRQLDAHAVNLKVLPSVDNIASGVISVDEVRKIRVEDLLGRVPVPPQEDLIKGSVAGKSILVTGAGGSIGSELVRQLVQLGPAKLILFEISEVALYQIHCRILALLEEMEAGGTDKHELPFIDAIIGSVQDEKAVDELIKRHGVQTIYHAAAYKHVPLVEHNPIAGLKNNVVGTRALARAALKNGVERFILISTDKAVRPTNVMGASKRLAEMVLQAMSREADCQTVFCMVRFGNVLDSSGSVVPRFRQQISDGGPLTVTHKDIVRYFMLTSEAVELVIQAGSLAQKGAVFVLDMGEPVKIMDLARTMINLAGLSVSDEKNPGGDIAIEITGLRPGEKLYEELLIGGDTSATIHPRIQLLVEPFEVQKELEAGLVRLEVHIEDLNFGEITRTLEDLVEGYEKMQL